MTLRTVAAIGGTLMLLTSSASALGAPAISEYAFEARDAQPTSIVSGPDGNLWATESSGTSSLDRITPAGVITNFKSGGPTTPVHIALGPDGKLWYVARGGPGAVGTIDLQTDAFREYPLTGAGNPVGIVAGRAGELWITLEGGNAALERFVASTQEATVLELPRANSKPAQIALGPEGDLWFTESARPGAIGRLDPQTRLITEYSTGLTGQSEPWGITSGPDGNVWFTDASKPGAIGRIDPRTGTIREFSAGLTVGTPREIAAGCDGNLYFTESEADGALGQITTSGAITEYTTGLSTESQPWGITPGPDGNVWFTERAKPAKVGRLAPARCSTPPAATSPPVTGPVTGSVDAGAAVAPVIGRLAVVSPLSGTILVRAASSRRFTTLHGAAAIPVGSLVDAAHGVVRLVSALDQTGRSQSARLWGGTFQVRQSASGRGMTHLLLRGSLASCARGARAYMVSARAHRPRSRRLWGQDEHGRYSTYGANSVATVLGTKWETIDTCAGTLTRVASGRVRVLDLHRHKSVLVAAGRSYLARP